MVKNKSATYQECFLKARVIRTVACPAAILVEVKTATESGVYKIAMFGASADVSAAIKILCSQIKGGGTIEFDWVKKRLVLGADTVVASIPGVDSFTVTFEAKEIEEAPASQPATPTIHDIVMSIIAAGRLKLEDAVEQAAAALSQQSAKIRKKSWNERRSAVNKLIRELLGLGRLKIDETPEGSFVESLVAA